MNQGKIENKWVMEKEKGKGADDYRGNYVLINGQPYRVYHIIEFGLLEEGRTYNFEFRSVNNGKEITSISLIGFEMPEGHIKEEDLEFRYVDLWQCHATLQWHIVDDLDRRHPVFEDQLALMVRGGIYQVNVWYGGLGAQYRNWRKV